MGTQTAGLAAGGIKNPGPNAMADEAETYDGSSWTEVADLNTARMGSVGFGTQTAGIAAGGLVPPGGTKTEVEEYNGTSWTEVNDIGTATYSFAGAWGTETAGGVVGGQPGYTNRSTLYDGTSWATSATLNQGRDRGGASTAGTPSAALIFGGAIQPSDNQTSVEELSGVTSAAEAADIDFD